jgi:hypothetical protein
MNAKLTINETEVLNGGACIMRFTDGSANVYFTGGAITLKIEIKPPSTSEDPADFAKRMLIKRRKEK